MLEVGAKQTDNTSPPEITPTLAQVVSDAGSAGSWQRAAH